VFSLVNECLLLAFFSLLVKGWSCKKPLRSIFVFKMVQVEELLELLNTLILSFVDNTVTINKTTLHSVVTSLQVMQFKAALLQTQTQLLNDALERKNFRQHCELVVVQNNHLFKEDDDVDSDQRPT
jgi:hypothetical protein